MAIPPPIDGFARYLMKSKFGAGRDFKVLDPNTEEQLFLIDGHIGTRPKAEVKGPDGKDLYKVRGKLLGIPKRIDVADASGEHVAHLHAKPFKFVHDKIEITFANGDEWLVVGSVMEKSYTVNDSNDRHVMQITQKWVTMRDKFIMDVADGVDPGLAFAVMWAIDRWVEHD
ncbi:LURP-one-related/scramblase family protein [Demequina oxidasica]|uniref:LURP-one-related/scramblase family protein n=1 Tax=Demequina oxidasica TaxID=676199 RepID=UPI000780DD00|nr:LURP-one-related family protein [Demequina oxidasica]